MKGRIAFYGGILLALTLFVLYATAMPGSSYRGRLPELSPDERQLQVNLKGHIVALAGAIGERRIGRGDSLAQSQAYIRATFLAIPHVNENQIQLEDVGASGAHAQNLSLEIPGDTRSIVLVGAHCDSAPLAPGADDNATGVAATLEIVRRLAPAHFHKTLRFVLFANEEPPYFQHAGMGSLAHTEACRTRGDQIDAMLSLESLGYYADGAGTQQYPWPVGWFYPDRGDFVGFIGNLGSRALVREAIGTFRAAASFPSEGGALPASIPGVGWSDHWAFWQQGYPAIMITDTATFRNPNYHADTDTPATIDYGKFARVTLGVSRVVEELANRP